MVVVLIKPDFVDIEQSLGDFDHSYGI